MLTFIRNWYYRMDSYLMILQCDLKFWREEGIFSTLHDDHEPINEEIWNG